MIGWSCNMNWENTYLQFKNKFPLDSVEANRLRQQMFDRYLSTNLPTKKLEAWKFTSLELFKKDEWQMPNSEESLLNHDQLKSISGYLSSDFFNFVFVNGELNKTLSDDLDLVLQIAELTADDFQKYNEATKKEENQKQVFTEAGVFLLAQSFLNKKIKIQLQSKVVLEKPVHILFVNASQSSIYLSENIEVVLADRAELNLLVQSISLSAKAPGALNLQIDSKLANDAKLNLVHLQNEELNQIHFCQNTSQVQSNTQLQNLCVSLGAGLNRQYLSTEFLGQNSSSEILGITLVEGEQHIDHYTSIEHSKGANQSLQKYKSILSDSSQCVFRGRVRIEPDAQKADSSQLNNNLLLSRKAQAHSIPQLEIYADDVKAGHGATVGQLSAEEIFYFLSRGINQYQATQMLALGFVLELVYKVGQASLQNYLLTAVKGKLDRMIQNV